MLETKPCSRCKEVKPLIEGFYVSNSRPCGRCSQCKDCMRAANLKRRQDPAGRAAIRASYFKNSRLKPEARMLYQARQRAKKKGMEFTITIEDIVIPKYCPVFGYEMKVGSGSASPTLDRIDNDLGYTPSNIIVISKRANVIKNDATIKEIIMVADFYKRLEKENKTGQPQLRLVSYA